MIEGPAFYPTLSARANLEVLAMLGGHPRARIGQLLEQVGLADRASDRYGSYSLGMKQRLGIAAALLPDPALLVLDEPANGLDPAGIIEIRDLLRGLADDGTTVFVSSHLLGEVEQISDWLVMIDHGRLLYDGPIDQILERQQHRADGGHRTAGRPDHGGQAGRRGRSLLHPKQRPRCASRPRPATPPT